MFAGADALCWEKASQLKECHFHTTTLWQGCVIFFERNISEMTSENSGLPGVTYHLCTMKSDHLHSAAASGFLRGCKPKPEDHKPSSPRPFLGHLKPSCAGLAFSRGHPQARYMGMRFVESHPCWGLEGGAKGTTIFGVPYFQTHSRTTARSPKHQFKVNSKPHGGLVLTSNEHHKRKTGLRAQHRNPKPKL